MGGTGRTRVGPAGSHLLGEVARQQQQLEIAPRGGGGRLSRSLDLGAWSLSAREAGRQQA